MTASSGFRRFCWGALAFVLFVILWGALVRATGSGAGCGSHWPDCHGQITPLGGSTKMLIEYTHRVTSGLSALVVLAQFAWARRLFDRGHQVRRAAGAAAISMLVEVMLGAAIVTFHLTAEDKSVERAAFMAIHLCNTFVLVGAMTLTAHWAGSAPRIHLRGRAFWLGCAALVGTMFVGASGAIAALGDTLFPAKDLGTAIARDLSSTAHFLVRLRIIHPFVAIGVAFLLLLTRHLICGWAPRPSVAKWGFWLRVTVVVQMLVGFLNVLMMAPTWMQLVHLFLADTVWIVLVLFIAEALVVDDTEATSLALSEAT